MKIRVVVYLLDTGLVQNLRHINLVSQVWVQLFRENLGSSRFSKKLKETLVATGKQSLKSSVLQLFYDRAYIFFV